MKKLFSLMALVGAALPATTMAEPPRPRLVVAISVDQFSADLFAEYRQTYVAGMKRLANAIVFPSGYQSHAATETCPGHSTILTGSHPARTGIIANDWYDMNISRGPRGSHKVYCSEDETKAGSTADNYVVSAVHLKMPTMGDRMKAADPRSRVVSVAGKDRAAVMMGGHDTDAIWYLDPKTTRSYVTLADRSVAEPAIVRAVNARLPALIDRPAMPVLPPQCASRSVAVKTEPGGPSVGVLAIPKNRFRTTPDFDRATADIAIGLIREMKLGHGPATDLIDIGLSANDYVGHAFGTEGAEMCAQQVALDQTVGRILAALDANGAPYVVVLTADHGGFDIPERHALRGITDAARLDPNFSLAAVSKDVLAELGLNLDPATLWSGSLGGDLYLSKSVSADIRPRVIQATRARLMAMSQVAAAFTAADIGRMPAPQPPVDDWSLAEKARASFDWSRSGDLIVLLKPRVVPIQKPGIGYTATHGSPWNYDRRVPMLFSYPGDTPHEEPLSVETVDILPTLAALIGLKIDAPAIDGRCIDLEPGPADTCTGTAATR
jgi:predicted AlkP superfamily pyrophosphatase or phosphodiesterase